MSDWKHALLQIEGQLENEYYANAMIHVGELVKVIGQLQRDQLNQLSRIREDRYQALYAEHVRLKESVEKALKSAEQALELTKETAG